MSGYGRCAAAALLLMGATALADPNDFRIYQLGQPGGGATPEANAHFRVFVRELAAAVTSVNLMPPETLGHSGWSAGGELSVIRLSREVPWPSESVKRGNSFGGGLLMPSVHLRKGFPFSLETGVRAGWLENSRMAAATAEAKWALNEGFAYLPDLGVRGHVTRLFNTRDFDLVDFGVDLGLGKQFAIGGMITLTPYVGWDLNWVSARSGLVDFQPERTEAQSLRTPTTQLTENTDQFQGLVAKDNSHSRFYGGVRFIGGVLQLGFEFSYSSLGRFHDEATGGDFTMPAVTALNFLAGLDY